MYKIVIIISLCRIDCIKHIKKGNDCESSMEQNSLKSY